MRVVEIEGVGKRSVDEGSVGCRGRLIGSDDRGLCNATHLLDNTASDRAWLLVGRGKRVAQGIENAFLCVADEDVIESSSSSRDGEAAESSYQEFRHL